MHTHTHPIAEEAQRCHHALVEINQGAFRVNCPFSLCAANNGSHHRWYDGNLEIFVYCILARILPLTIWLMDKVLLFVKIL